MERIQYKTPADKEKIIAERTAAGKVLLEEQNHLDGNFLIFGDEYPPEPAKQETIEQLIERKVKEMVVAESLKESAKT